MAARTKEVWKEGDTGWEVDWCKEIPLIDYGDGESDRDLDNQKRGTRNFRTREEAVTYAKEVLPKAVDGDIQITPFVLERLVDEHPFHIPHNCSKEYTDDGEWFEGEAS